jgi:hypothetical protein
MFGAISACAFVFDALAVRLWFVGWRKAGGFIGVIAALAFVVTFSNSVGGIVSRADKVQSRREQAADSRRDDRRELGRLEMALADLGPFKPTDDAAVPRSETRTRSSPFDQFMAHPPMCESSPLLRGLLLGRERDGRCEDLRNLLRISSRRLNSLNVPAQSPIDVGRERTLIGSGKPFQGRF